MSDLTSIEKAKLEKLLEMESGYVLDFSNRTFQEFILESVKLDIYDEKYNYQSGSKANRLRAFWKEEANNIVGVLIENLLEYCNTKNLINNQIVNLKYQELFNECQNISKRLKKGIINNFEKEAINRYQLSVLQSELLSEFDKFAFLIYKSYLVVCMGFCKDIFTKRL